MELYQGTSWNEIIAGLRGAHILQTWEWGQFKSFYGWQPLPQVWKDAQNRATAAALVLKRSIRGGLSMLYVPRGPLVDWDDVPRSMAVAQDLQLLAKKSRAIFIKMDPEIITGAGIPGVEGETVNRSGEDVAAQIQRLGWRYSQEQVQFRNTVWLDLSGGEEDWLARMKQKTRYNLRLAQRKGVVVRPGRASELPLLYRMYAQTSVRDGFVIRSEEYYLRLWRSFMECGLAESLVAEVDGEAVAGLFLFFFAGRAWYLYGMSSPQHRDKMPNYLLQWEAMRRAKARGCAIYDLGGAPEVFSESDPMWGVFRFKEGLGGKVIRTAGAWDYPARPQLYVLYTRILPRILDLMRRRGKERARQEAAL
jgi:lipid II:glycine glycyltransferase (peptidoglycan interpeptide bridge formation enzyme)